MPKYWGKQIFSLGRFPEVGQKQKTERERKKERPQVGNNNGQLRIATPPRVVHAKPPGPIFYTPGTKVGYSCDTHRTVAVIVVKHTGQ